MASLVIALVRKKAIVLILVLLVLSCGYRFSGVGHLPGGIHTVYITVLENPTGETGIESILSNDFVNEFMRNGNGVCSSQSKADGILRGRITDLSIQAVAHRGGHSTLARRVTIFVDVELTDTAGNIIREVKGASANQSYDVIADNKSATEQNRRLAIESLSKRVAETVYNRMIASF